MIGFVAGKMNLISEKGQKDITQLVLYVTMPATIFSAMQLEMSEERLNTAFMVLGVMAFCYVVMFLVGFFSSKRLPLTKGSIIDLQCGYDSTILWTTEGLFGLGDNGHGQLALGDSRDR